MCFGFKSTSAKGTTASGTDDAALPPARKVSSPQPSNSEGESLKPAVSEKPEKSAKLEKKKWNDDEYGDSVR
ncbi:hypothetical protein V491_01641 [Pseudogymnoascus sp. VKM F-3775]|nr:hypothetical protein V491_01641 [Pseudogymnoascus sp. VKM F-3775]